MASIEKAEDVLKDLESLDLDGLKLMCRHRSLSDNGDKQILLHRLKCFFGFESESLESDCGSTKQAKQGKKLLN